MAPQPFCTPANIEHRGSTTNATHHRVSMQTRTRFPRRKGALFTSQKGEEGIGKNIKFESLEFPWGYLAQTMSAILKHHSSPSSPLYALTLSWMWPDLASHQTSTNHVECIGSFTEKWCFTEICWSFSPEPCQVLLCRCLMLDAGMTSSSHQDTPSGHLDLSAFHVHKSLKHTHTYVYVYIYIY